MANTKLDNYEVLYRALNGAENAAIACRSDATSSELLTLAEIGDLLSDAISNCSELIREEREAGEPGADTARDRGCSCRLPLNPYDDPTIDRGCPLHGRNPDMGE